MCQSSTGSGLCITPANKEVPLKSFAVLMLAGALVAGVAAQTQPATTTTTTEKKQGAGQDMKDAGNGMKDAAHATGHAAKKTGSAVAKTTKKGAHKVAHETKKG